MKPDNDQQPQREPYEPPEIIDRGDVRDVTLGGSPGTGDSANPVNERTF